MAHSSVPAFLIWQVAHSSVPAFLIWQVAHSSVASLLDGSTVVTLSNIPLSEQHSFCDYCRDRDFDEVWEILSPR